MPELARYGFDTALRKAVICFALVPICIGVFTALLTLAAMVPNATILENSLDRPDVLLSRRADNGRVIDADTECIGLSVGMIEMPDEKPMVRAIRAQSVYGCDHYIDHLAGGQSFQPREYARYWHGYTIISRPVLSVLTYNDLRGILFACSVVLFGLLLWRIGTDFSAQTALALAVPFLVLNAMGFWVVATKAVSWFLVIGGAIILPRRVQPPLIGFFVLGALTAFFDFLTAPALIFALPALLFVLGVRARGDVALFDQWRDVIWLGVFWAAGYAGLWACKITLADAMLEGHVWADALSQAAFRLRGETHLVEAYWPGMALYKNLAALKSLWGPIAIGLFVIGPLSTAARRGMLMQIVRHGRLPLALACVPLIFMELLSNHAQIHAAFTQLNFAPLFFIAALILVGEGDRLLAKTP